MMFELFLGVLVIGLGGLSIYLYVSLKSKLYTIDRLQELRESKAKHHQSEVEALNSAAQSSLALAKIEKEKAKVVGEENEALTKELTSEKEKYAKLINQKKSAEVRLGQIGEHLAPFLTDWPWDSKNFRFLGNPIDGIQFNEDEIVLVEIKTGKSQLSKNQRTVRDLIKNGQVKWAEFRIGKDECSTKIIERIQEDEEGTD